MSYKSNKVKANLKRVLRGLGFDNKTIIEYITYNVPLSRAVKITLTRDGLSIVYESGVRGHYKFKYDFLKEQLNKRLGKAEVVMGEYCGGSPKERRWKVQEEF